MLWPESMISSIGAERCVNLRDSSSESLRLPWFERFMLAIRNGYIDVRTQTIFVSFSIYVLTELFVAVDVRFGLLRRRDDALRSSQIRYGPVNWGAKYISV